jgi:hypothetical protein
MDGNSTFVGYRYRLPFGRQRWCMRLERCSYSRVRVAQRLQSCDEAEGQHSRMLIGCLVRAVRDRIAFLLA